MRRPRCRGPGAAQRQLVRSCAAAGEQAGSYAGAAREAEVLAAQNQITKSRAAALQGQLESTKLSLDRERAAKEALQVGRRPWSLGRAQGRQT